MYLYYLDTKHADRIIVRKRKNNFPIAAFKKSDDESNMISFCTAMLHCFKLEDKANKKGIKRRKAYQRRKDKP